MRHRWETLPSGLVIVDGFAITLQHPAEVMVMRRDVMRWLPNVRYHCEKHNVPDAWALGTIKAESGGDPEIVSPDRGFGLMQLTHPAVFKGFKPEQTLRDPDLNISLGVSLMGSIRRRVGYDLPKIASCYNAGGTQPHPSTRSPWGMRETPGHIERVVRAANTAHDLLKELPMSHNERLAAEAERILANGELGDKTARGDEWESYLDEAFGRGDQLRGKYSSCAYSIGAMKIHAGIDEPRDWPAAYAITTWLGLSFQSKAWIPYKPGMKFMRGDIPYWCSGNANDWWKARDGHVAGLLAGAANLWQTVEGGGGNDGTNVRISKEMKDIRTHEGRPLRGVWRLNKLVEKEEGPHVPDTQPDLKIVRPTLREGSADQPGDVRVVQRIVGAKQDGDFGPKTKAKVEDKQRELGLVADGIVGPKTWEAFAPFI